jgi:hypothetical protein
MRLLSQAPWYFLIRPPDFHIIHQREIVKQGKACSNRLTALYEWVLTRSSEFAILPQKYQLTLDTSFSFRTVALQPGGTVRIRAKMGNSGYAHATLTSKRHLQVGMQSGLLDDLRKPLAKCVTGISKF